MLTLISINILDNSIGFDRKGEFSVGNGFRCNVIIFGVDMNSSVYVDIQLISLKILRSFV